MPNRANSESRLISALINSQDVQAAPRYGVNDEMLVAHATEYRWLTSFPAVFGHQPSVESLLSKFPDFPYIYSALFDENNPALNAAPKPVKEGVAKDEAEKIKAALEEQGAKVEIK